MELDGLILSATRAQQMKIVLEELGPWRLVELGKASGTKPVKLLTLARFYVTDLTLGAAPSFRMERIINVMYIRCALTQVLNQTTIPTAKR